MSGRDRTAKTNHPLVIYRRLVSYYGWPSAWLLVVSAGLLVWDEPALEGLTLALALAALLSLTLLLLTLIMSRLASVRCGEDGLLVQLPFHRVHVPYEIITSTRTAALGTLFPPSRQPFTSRAFLNPLWQLPAVVVEVEWLPLPRWQLRLWMDSRMILKGALVLLVKDHTTLRSQMDEAMIRWRAARQAVGG
jgi:hypothetical protein